VRLTYPHCDTTTLSTFFGWQRVRLTKIGSPIASSNGHNDDGGTNGGSDFLRRLDAETHMTFRVSNDNDGLKSSALTSTGLLLDWLDLDGRKKS
jgi:hypothetical protein